MNVARARRRTRQFTGCWRCRERKVKCDEGSPCSACQRLGLPCDDSSTRLIWLNEIQQSYRSTGRRLISCERTWGNLPPLDSHVVDLLIAQCDGMEIDVNQHLLSGVADHYNPFLVFSGSSPTSFGLTVNHALANGGFHATHATHANSDDNGLFHHYANYVASVMMPFEHPWNPWKKYYPAVSLNYSAPGERALYHAILAHAAFNLTHLGADTTKMMRLAANHYNTSIQHINEAIQLSGDQGSGGTLAAIMTLMMAEVYSGQSRKWKHHLQGAWALLLNSSSTKPWDESRFACFSTQSLLIVKIIGNTTLTDCTHSPLALPPSAPAVKNCISSEDTMSALTFPSLSDNAEITYAASISSTPQFGFTIGARRSLLECISAITTVSQQLRANPPTKTALDADRTVSQVLACLDTLRTHEDDDSHLETNDSLPTTDLDQSAPLFSALARYQLNAFIYATYIYLYRTLTDAPPQRVAPYVSLAFQNISAFCAESSGNFSLWPAFIAAVEAYTPEDMQSARQWLEQSINFGLGNRLPVKRIIEEVWRRRDDAHFERAMDKGLVAVDWRDLVRDLGIDILLV